jgi:hypothetical protein
MMKVNGLDFVPSRNKWIGHWEAPLGARGWHIELVEPGYCDRPITKKARAALVLPSGSTVAVAWGYSVEEALDALEIEAEEAWDAAWGVVLQARKRHREASCSSGS